MNITMKYITIISVLTFAYMCANDYRHFTHDIAFHMPTYIIYLALFANACIICGIWGIAYTAIGYKHD